MHPGDVVAGKYRVQNILGRAGGMLLEARHTEFDQRVVIRMLAPALCDAKEIESFRREARTLSKLESEHVARIIDVGTHSDGSFFLVRQYLEGIDLASHLRKQGALRLEEAVLYILQACEAVQECHSHKILLREIQPAHLFLTRKRGGDPLVKIIDFGTAKLLKDAKDLPPGEATATVMLGMSQYASPQLLRKQTVDHRTDVWSLGCILYELLAAVPPFQGEMAELMMKITREEPIPLSQLRPDIPREFDQIISWALAKDPASRFSSVYAMAHALKPYATPEGQVLIDRIGRLAHAKDDASGGTAQISPTSPLAKRSPSAPPSHNYVNDEDATVMRSYPGYGGAAEEESEFEKTAFLPDSYGTSRSSYPPPPAASSRGSHPPASSRRGSVPPPPTHSRPGISGSWSSLAIDPDPAGSPYSQASTTGAYPAPTAVETRRRQRKVALYAFAASLLLLPVLVTVLVFALRDRPSEPTALAQNEPTVATPDPVVPTPDDDAADSATSAPMPSADSQVAASQEAVEPPPPPPTAPFPTPDPTHRVAPRPPPPKPDPRRVAPKPNPKPDPEPPKSSGKTGTLVAIAIGGSCAFAVDGAPKGTKSSIRITVSVGTHTVSCSPPGKGTRTQRVSVKDDKPGIASFRLN